MRRSYKTTWSKWFINQPAPPDIVKALTRELALNKICIKEDGQQRFMLKVTC
jgi:hypothetical protein